MHRDLEASDFEGKTIKRANVEAVNILRLEFTDGTKLVIETEDFAMMVCTCESETQI